MGKISGRTIKNRLMSLLDSGNTETLLEELRALPPSKAVNILFSLLYRADDTVRRELARAMGVVVAELADKDMEAARVVMRRLMWNLNDESGGIGWGSPEAMGEIVAIHDGLAKEYGHILLSYASSDGNYLEYTPMQRGLLWGIRRFAEARPHIVRDMGLDLMLFLKSEDPEVKRLAGCLMKIIDL